MSFYPADLARIHEEGFGGAGFSSEALDRYCDFDFCPGYIAFVSTR